jgi:plastocyanin
MTRRSVHCRAAVVLAAGAFMLAGQSHALSPPVQAASVQGAFRLSTDSQGSHIVGTVLLHHRVVKVSIVNFTFKPAHLVVSPGTRIIWTNKDSDPHTVTSDAGAFTSGALDTGNRYARTLRAAGVVHYHCKIHPFMHGTVTVKG